MELQAGRRDITIEQRQFLQLTFELSDLTDETLPGKNIFFVLQNNEGNPHPIEIQDQGSLTVTDSTVAVELTPDHTDWKYSRWYEVWVEWAAGQWQKQFKGLITTTPSGNYNENG